ncbi:SDR family NAD(P)-dependent oxidoreductase [bacterium]|nr:MAG: SDR family NAD(P)-dependent oxidoreductase [bacterium]
MKAPWTGRVAVVTGGAGGLGRATARALARQGCRVALWDLDGAAAQAAAEALKAEGFSARGWGLDACDAGAVRAALAETEAAFGPVWLLDNNAGIVAKGDFLDQDEAAWDRTMAVNLRSHLVCTKAVLPGMVRRKSGHLVFIASAAGLLGVPGMALYSASKHAVVGFADSLRLELSRAKAGVGVTIVCPSFINTGMFDGASPPLLAGWLTPETVAERTVSAVRSNKVWVTEPWIVKTTPLVKTLPQPLVDRLASWLGIHDAMTGFKGRRG